jgi:hypothetical protein
MTKLLEKAFEEAAKLPESEQDSLAQVLLEELASERRWDQLFAQSHDLLSDLAAEALAEDRTGRTQVLDPDKL